MSHKKCVFINYFSCEMSNARKFYKMFLSSEQHYTVAFVMRTSWGSLFKKKYWVLPGNIL